MNWQPVVYCFSLAALMASVVMGVFSPFCRKRQPVAEGGPAEERGISLVRRPHAAAPATEKERIPEKDRIGHAMRNWTAVRADADLTYVPPPPPPEPAPEPAVAAEIQAEPRPVECQVIELPPISPAAETEAQAEPETRGTLAEPNPFLMTDFHGAPNFYEILQISPRADLETIHRVYRIMAARFHPDNPVSGDHEVFLKLCQAYEVLSRPERRALYDHALRLRSAEPNPVFGERIFVDGTEGELHRRFGILALLYQRRRTNQGSMGISTLELETRMALPREHLEFTLWYLRCKSLVQILEDNSDYAVTASGVDYVEANLAKNPILRELLIAGGLSSRPPSPATSNRQSRTKDEARRGRRDRSRGVVVN